MKKFISIISLASFFAYNAFAASENATNVIENRTNQIEQSLNNY